MKKTLFAFAIAALSLLVFSCKKDDLGKINPSEESVIENEAGVLTSFTTSVNMEEGTTKMSYDMETRTDDYDGQWRIKKTWDVGDELIGFQVDGKEYRYFTFAATAIDEKKNEVTWTRQAGKYTEGGNEGKPMSVAGYPSIPGEGEKTTIQLAFAPGVEAYGFNGDGAISINSLFRNQKDGKQMTIVSGYAEINHDQGITEHMTNQMALLSIVAPKLKDGADKMIDHIEVDGVYTNATLKLNNENHLVLTDGKTQGYVELSPKDGDTWVTDSDGNIKVGDESKTFFIPLITNSESKKLNVNVYTKTENEGKWTMNPSPYYWSTSAISLSAKAYRAKDKEFKFYDDVAKVGDDCFSTFSAAVDNALENSPATITLLKDCKITSAVSEIGSGKDITLDLNGNKLTVDADAISDGDQSDYRLIVDGGTLTIQDAEGGGCVSEIRNTHNIIVKNEGTLNVKGGSITSSQSAAIYATSGTINITGGTLTGESSSTGAIGLAENATLTVGQQSKQGDNSAITISSDGSRGIFIGPSATATIYYGTISGTSALYLSGGTTNDKKANFSIEGGKFSASGEKAILKKSSTKASSKCITAGLFDKPCGSYLADNYLIDYSKPTDGFYSIRKYDSQQEAILNGDFYEDVDGALSEANKSENSSYIQLVKDSELDSVCSVAKDITLNLAGKALSVNGSKRIDVASNGTFTLCSIGAGGTTTTTGKINQTSTGSTYGLKSSGTLTINSGTIYSAATYATLRIEGGTTTISGGYITQENSGTKNAISYLNNPTITISGGYFKSVGAVIFKSGGDISCSLSGGFYSKEPSTKYVSIDDGYKTQEDQEEKTYPWSVVANSN